MKKILPLIAVFMVLAGLVLYVSADTAAPQDQSIPGYGIQRSQGKGGPWLLMRYVRENMAAQTVAEIAKQPVEVIRKKLEEQRLPAVLAEFQVDRKAFSDGMHAKVQDLLGRLVEGSYLTVDQKTQILAQMDQFAQRRELMKSLIDKAVTDGTITPEQAQMLLKRPR
ncbi:MAG: DUF2680 domain-containing protein [Hyphomicrobiales bacterium]